ncbi:MAG: CTP synthase [Candidatus Marinimicrobia bacterium]|nr:CTP synthase [Candidatus Neomarinimicrobiota bacterium]
MKNNNLSGFRKYFNRLITSKRENKTKFIFITGGVISGLGKGITASSIGYLLKQAGFKVTIQKFDPYLNVDPGTLSPFQHGEVFVTDDGAETDLDLGHYERFLDEKMSQKNNTTAGKIYETVIKKERRGDFLGATVQIIPHITDEIKNRLVDILNDRDYDFIITEVGGTVGDIESLPFLEAIRQLEQKLDDSDFLNIHVTLLPYIYSSEEIKTKPTQHSVMKLREIGLRPSIIVCRTEKEMLNNELREKIALFCDVKKDAVFEAYDASTIYEVPLILFRQNIISIIKNKLKLEKISKINTEKLKQFVSRIKNPSNNVKIAIIGKYTSLPDAYKSIMESFIHAGAENDTKVELKWISAENLESNSEEHVTELLGGIDGLLIPGGFGERGIEGKITAAKFARTNKMPFFGICLGLHVALIEYARNVANLTDANSTEFHKNTVNPVIDLMLDQKNIVQKGGTMRLGAYDCKIEHNSLAYTAYEKKNISERHRHRYEVNNDHKDQLKKAGIIFSGINKELNLVEIIELRDHPWYLAVQFHPEFKSRVSRAHPLFREFVKASLKYKIELDLNKKE